MADSKREEEGGDGVSEEEVVKALRRSMTEVAGFPKPGVTFYDYTTVLADAVVFKQVINLLHRRYAGKGITHVASCEARGLALGAPLAFALGCSFVPLRKPRKLPRETVAVNYGKGFTESRLEVHADVLDGDSRVVVIDDVIASGKTMLASAQLIAKCGATVHECVVLAGMPELSGTRRVRSKGLPLYVMLPETVACPAEAEGAAAATEAAVGKKHRR